MHTAINGKEIVYFIGPYDRKNQIELEINELKKIKYKPVGIMRYKNKQEIY